MQRRDPDDRAEPAEKPAGAAQPCRADRAEPSEEAAGAAQPRRVDRANPAEKPAGVMEPLPVDAAERAVARRRRMAEVFGDVLPETTGDDDPDTQSPSRAHDIWYIENRPPHHYPS